MPTRRTYDHRIRAAIVASADPNLFPTLNIPRSTASAWIHRGARDVVGVDDDCTALLVRAQRLERQLRILVQVVRLLLALRRVSSHQLDLTRLPDGNQKHQLLRAINRARKHLPLRHALHLLGLTPARYQAWVTRQTTCSLDDRPSCPRIRSSRLSFDEVRRIGDMVQSPDYRHMSIRALALHAQRVGRVFVHPVTWGRLIRERGWRRCRVRVYPAKPKVGIRAQQVNEYWHVDASIIRLVDGTRVYLHAVIDNFSRRILAWRVEERLHPLNTFEVLSDAAAGLEGATPADVLMDAGSENVNGTVDDLFGSGRLRRILAQVDVTFSNSLIEAWWRSLKHQWLYLHHLDSLATVRRLVGFYVREHNEVMPHAAFNGPTPDEVYFDKTDIVVESLARCRASALVTRIAANRRSSCPECPRAPPTESDGRAA